MSLRKRGAVWWVDISPPSGDRIRCTTGTSDRKAAQEFHDKVKAESWRVGKLNDRPRRTWDEAALKFLQESEGKASLKDYARQVSFWTQCFRGKNLDSIARQMVADHIEKKADTPATRNRYVACIRAVLRKAAGPWEWLDRAPKLKTYAEPKKRVRWITREEAARLLSELSPWLADMARFALSTGLRQANVLGLEWEQVDLVRRVAWIHAEQAKAGEAIGVPLNEDAMGVIRRQIGKHLRRVFVGPDGAPLDLWTTPARKGWVRGCARAGIKEFRWHDLRHTWASWHVQAATPLYTLQELGGWKTTAMVGRYAHLAPEHLQRYADRVTLDPVAHSRHSGGQIEKQEVV